MSPGSSSGRIGRSVTSVPSCNLTCFKRLCSTVAASITIYPPGVHKARVMPPREGDEPLFHANLPFRCAAPPEAAPPHREAAVCHPADGLPRNQLRLFSFAGGTGVTLACTACVPGAHGGL